MNQTTLRYANERDKIYGLAGMAITLVALDGEKYLSEIRLDAPAGECLVMSHDYGFKGNPRMSARIVWEQTLSDLRMTTSIILGNIVCRRYVLGHCGIAADDLEPVRAAVRSDARDHCDLDDDESDRLFDGCLNYVQRIFRHSGVQEVAHTFAGHIGRRRTLSGSEAIEILSSLGLS